MSESQINNPAGLIAFLEQLPFHDFRQPTITGSNAWLAPYCFEKSCRQNVAFLDGHAKAYPVDTAFANSLWWSVPGAANECFAPSWFFLRTKDNPQPDMAWILANNVSGWNRDVQDVW